MAFFDPELSRAGERGFLCTVAMRQDARHMMRSSCFVQEAIGQAVLRSSGTDRSPGDGMMPAKSAYLTVIVSRCVPPMGGIFALAADRRVERLARWLLPPASCIAKSPSNFQHGRPRRATAALQVQGRQCGRRWRCGSRLSILDYVGHHILHSSSGQVAVHRVHCKGRRCRQGSGSMKTRRPRPIRRWATR